MSHYFPCLLLFSCLLNVYNLFQYKLNTELDERFEFPFEKRNEDSCENDPYECNVFDSFKIVTKFLNDILASLSALTIDLFLLKHVHKDIEAKSHVHTDEASQRKFRKCMKNTNRLVLTSGILFCLAHTPEFVLTVLMTIYRKKITSFCAERLSCDLVNEEALVFYLFSMCGQIVVLLKFNSRFRESFLNFISKIKVRIQNIRVINHANTNIDMEMT